MTERDGSGPSWDKGERPDAISQYDLELSLREEGREQLAIYPPAHIQHHCQTLAGELADDAKEAIKKMGVDEELAERIATRIATSVGLKHFVGAMDFGYAQRVLEERAGLPELTQSHRLH